MNIYLCFAVALTGTIFGLVLKKSSPEIGLCLSIISIVIIFFSGIEYIKSLIANIENLGSIDTEIFEIPIKILGLGIISKVSSLICEDAGEKGMAFAISTITKFASLCIAFPLFEKLLEQIKEVVLL